jgi:hypothetical protein
MKDLYHALKLVKSYAPKDEAADATDEVGAIIDRAGYQSLVFAIMTGLIADAGAVFSVKIEEGDDSGLSDAAAVAAADLQVLTTSGSVLDATPEATFQCAFDQANDGAIGKIGYIGNKRYVRMTISPVGNSTSSDPIAVLAILSHATHQPVPAA